MGLEDFKNQEEFVQKKFSWFGEGDDMIFIDGDTWPPTLHGTGLEDYFNAAWCPVEKYNSFYHGIIAFPEGPGWSGKTLFYRFHIKDPIHFAKSIKVMIEHEHTIRRNDDYSSTAYWYQLEPHKKFQALPPVSKRLPNK